MGKEIDPAKEPTKSRAYQAFEELAGVVAKDFPELLQTGPELHPEGAVGNSEVGEEKLGLTEPKEGTTSDTET